MGRAYSTEYFGHFGPEQPVMKLSFKVISEKRFNSMTALDKKEAIKSIDRFMESLQITCAEIKQIRSPKNNTSKK